MSNLFNIKLGKWNALTGILAEAGFTEELAEIVLHEPSLATSMVTAILAAIEARTTVPGDVFKVRVDYSKPLKEMISSGGYDWVAEPIVNCTLPGGGITREMEMRYIGFNRPVTTQEVLEEMRRKRLRPANLAELCAFGETNPQAQHEFPIVSLSVVWTDESGRGCPFLDCGANGRRLNYVFVDEPDHQWGREFQFLAVNK